MEKHVSIARALKEKSRLVGRINILTDVINHQNSLAEGSTVHHVIPAPDDLLWADERRTRNTRRRKLQDERTQRGDYRKPGWELMPDYLKRAGA